MSSNLLLKEGGLAGHMSHLYEDPDLTFGKMKQIFLDAVEGRLQGTEKLDGQNIFISYSAKDGRARAVRNKGQIRAGGLDAAGLAQAFQGRDTLETAFNEAFESFENVAKSFSGENVQAIFGEDANIFYNCEIMDPRNANVVHYDDPVLVMHETGHTHIDKETGVISGVDASANANALKSALERQHETVGKQNFKVQINAVTTLQKLENNEPAKKATAALDSELSDYGLGDGNTIGEYLATKILKVIEERVPDLPVENKTLLAKRLVGSESISITQVKKGLSAEQKQYLEEFVPSGKKANKIIQGLKKQAIGPIELIVHEFTVEALKGLQSAFILDQGKEVERLRGLLANAIEMIQSETVKQHYPQAMDVLEIQLKKIGAAGVENVSTASEGFVFAIDDQVYKFTGNFAPVNQILGMLKYGRGDVAPIEKLVQTVEQIASGERKNVEYMAAVGFKPPHKGHIEMIKKAVDKAASHNTNFTIFTGRTPRGEITLGKGLEILKIFLQDQGIQYGNGPGEVRVVPSAEGGSPMGPMIDAITELPEDSTVFIVSSTDDPGRGAGLRKSVQKDRDDVEVFDYTVDITTASEGEGKLSATDMRKTIADHDFDAFKNFIPEESVDKAEHIWTTILGRKSNSQTQVSESKKKSVDPVNYDILGTMILEELDKNKEFLDLLQLFGIEDEESEVEVEEEDTVEEISASGAAAAEYPAGITGRRKEKKKQNTIIREIYNYLVNKDIIKESTDYAN